MITLGTRSLERLSGVHPDLVRVVKRAATLATPAEDFTVLCGVRTEQEQLDLFAQGRTKPGAVVTWTKNSPHMPKADGYGHAVDLAPFPIDWTNTARFNALADLMFLAAKQCSVNITWGADWDGDGKRRERGESDSPHFQLFR